MTKKSKKLQKKKKPEYNEDGIWIETKEEIDNWKYI
jgi:hypothetical protein